MNESPERAVAGASRSRSSDLQQDPRNDRQLVYSARLGDERAFDALFYRYRDGIFRLAVAITKDPRTAEEIVVDTFARAYRALERLEPDDSLRPWLYRVAINESYDRRPRRGYTTSPLEDAADDLVASEDGSPAERAERAELRRVVLEAIDTLGPKHRTVVILHYLNELSLAEIAVIAECPIGTVKSRLHYALRHLRTHLSPHPGLRVEPRGSRGATGIR